MATSSSSTRSTGCPGPWRRFCTRRWRTTSSTSSSARGPRPGRSGWTFPATRWSGRWAAPPRVGGGGGGEGGTPRRSRGTPRIANRLLRRVRDYAQVRSDGRVTLEAAADALALFEVDERGLDRLDLAILSALVERFDGGPVGLSTLSAAVGEETGTIEEVYEPYLLQIGFLQRTPRGRVATEAAYRHLGTAPDGRLV